MASELCMLCRRINIESITRPGGYQHVPNFDTWRRNAEFCRICSILSSQFLSGIPKIHPKPSDRDAIFCTLSTCPVTLTSMIKWKNGHEGELYCVSTAIEIYTDEGIVSIVLEILSFKYLTKSQLGDPAAKYGIRIKKRLSNTASLSSFQIASNWLRYCLSYHDCSDSIFGQGIEDTELKLKLSLNQVPKRLIDTEAFGTSSQDVRLVYYDSNCSSYITLSYCWGQNISETYTTTVATIQDREQRIVFKELPRTFRDAIEISRRLRIRHLWIDAICIVQDSTVDWEREAPKMGAIYAKSTLTVAANMSTHANGGCFNTSSQTLESGFEPIVKVESELADKSKSCLFLCYRLDPHKFNPLQPIDDGAVTRRGWTLQERMLSPRTLHYTSHQLFWECRNNYFCEDNLFFGSSASWEPTIPRLVICRPQSDKEFAIRCQLENWYRHVARPFSRRHLTFATDKFPALSGIASIFAARLQAAYLAGIWLKDTNYGETWDYGLGWVPAGEKTGDKDPLCPSFSWASYAGPVVFCPRKSPREFEIVDYKIQTATSDPLGRVLGGALTIRGHIGKVTVVHHTNFWSHELDYFGSGDANGILKSEETRVGIAKMDSDYHSGLFFCLFLGVGYVDNYFILLLSAKSQSNWQFQRKGFGMLKRIRRGLVKDCSRRTIEIS
jgi:hypothetical protein